MDGKLGLTDRCPIYILILVSMTLTLMQGHSWSANVNKSTLQALGKN